METTVNEVSNFLAGTFAMTAYWILAIAGTIVFGLTLLTGLLGLGGVDHADLTPQTEVFLIIRIPGCWTSN